MRTKACAHGIGGRHTVNGEPTCEQLDPNAEDYWLGPWPRDTRTDWISADDILRLMEARTIGMWTNELEAIEDLMSESNTGGGLRGLAPEYHPIRAGLIKLGATA